VNAATRTIGLTGPVGNIEVALDAPVGSARGLAVVSHPHPLFGGTLDNKVVQTLARALLALGYLVARPNFRGVGATQGTYDQGRGEVDDLIEVVSILRHERRLDDLVLAGFSFGSVVSARAASQLHAAGRAPQKLVLVGTAAGRWDVPSVPANTLVIHGEKDDTVPLSAVLDWASPQELPVVVIPGADHFFHHKLTLIKRIVQDAWQGDSTIPRGATIPQG